MVVNLSIFSFKMSKLVRVFFKKLLWVILLVAALDMIIGRTLRHFYFTEKAGPHYAIMMALDYLQEDHLIFGSSRAARHYVPEVLQEMLGESFFNVGQDGQGIFYHLAVLRAILKRHKPKIVILDLNRSDLMYSKESYDRLATLLPYYETHFELRSLIYLRSEYEKIKLFSQTYPFNSMLIDIILGHLRRNHNKWAGWDRGYIPLYKKLKEKLEKEEVQPTKFDEVKTHAYESFIQEAIRSGARVYVFVSPRYFFQDSQENTLVLAREIALRNGAEFYDHSQHPLFLQRPELFGDRTHLNDAGARIFSEIISMHISLKGR